MEWRRQVVRPGGVFQIGPAAEQLQRLGLRRRREGDVGDAGHIGAARHLGGQEVFSAELATVGQFLEFFSAEHLLELGCCFAGLGAVGLVGDDGKAFALRGSKILNRLEGEGKGLDRADHDLLASR
ncbi:hypothetical protein D3C87_1675020 [compost metagenome]